MSGASRVAVITAIYGNYEASCKRFAPQTIPTDFICFTNIPEIKANGWQIDTEPYHITHRSPLDTGADINSIDNNKHTFNIAKYYKQNFYRIPRLANYDMIIWVDGTVELFNKTMSEWCLAKINTHGIITWEHEGRAGFLRGEVKASHFERYTSTYWFGQHQPYQDIDAQYAAYLKDGYDETLWKRIEPTRRNLGVWLTCFVAFDMRSPRVKEFLDLWYKQTLQYTTQDQIGFPYTVQKTGLIPYTLPDAEIHGQRPHSQTGFYIKHTHGR